MGAAVRSAAASTNLKHNDMVSYKYYLVFIAPVHGYNIDIEVYPTFLAAKNRANHMRDALDLKSRIYGVNTESALDSIDSMHKVYENL